MIGTRVSPKGIERLLGIPDVEHLNLPISLERDVVEPAGGSSGASRCRLTATTAGALAFLGTLLGVAGAYVVLSATYYDDLGY